MIWHLTQMGLVLSGLLGGVWAFTWMTSWDDDLRRWGTENRAPLVIAVGCYFFFCALHKVTVDRTRRDMERAFGGPLPGSEKPMGEPTATVRPAETEV